MSVRLRLAAAAATVAVFVGGAAGLLLDGPASASDPVDATTVRSDPGDATSSPLDLRTVDLVQAGTRLELRLVTAGDWRPASLSPSGGRRLCVLLRDVADAARSVCVVGIGGRAALVDVAADGQTTPVDALVGRPDDRTLLASFAPSAIGLPAGTFTWQVESRWTAPNGCTAEDGKGDGCADLAPDDDPVRTRTDVLVRPRCYGAAARDLQHPCANPALRTTVKPKPSDALLSPNAPCARQPEEAGVTPCVFGLAAAPGRPNVALIGDSHAAHWRGAVEVVAQSRGWHAISFTRSGCPFTLDPTNGTPSRNAACKRWVDGVRRWLAAHPEVHTVVTSSHALADTPERRADYRRTWASLPAAVSRIFVLRDTPAIATAQVACVNRAIARKQPAGLRCSQPRATNLRPDPNAAAARAAIGQSRVKVIDLTPFMCSPTRCLAVVGGVLLRKDGEHLTPEFSETLGPYVNRAIGLHGAPG